MPGLNSMMDSHREGREGHKSERKCGIMMAAMLVPHHEKAMCIGITGERSLSNRSLTQPSHFLFPLKDVIHMAGCLKALPHI